MKIPLPRWSRPVWITIGTCLVVGGLLICRWLINQSSRPPNTPAPTLTKRRYQWQGQNLAYSSLVGERRFYRLVSRYLQQTRPELTFYVSSVTTPEYFPNQKRFDFYLEQLINGALVDDTIWRVTIEDQQVASVEFFPTPNWVAALPAPRELISEEQLERTYQRTVNQPNLTSEYYLAYQRSGEYYYQINVDKCGWLKVDATSGEVIGYSLENCSRKD